ncbi:MAG: hypothetical protein PVSMB4_10180 [Ktedonobacterales bacterium]
MNDLQTDAVLSSVLSRIALVNKSDFHRLSHCLLNLLCQLSDGRAVVLVCCRYRQRQQVSQRIDGDVRLAAFAPVRTVVAPSLSALGAGL